MTLPRRARLRDGAKYNIFHSHIGSYGGTMRLAGKQKLGYFPLPLAEAERIRRFLQFPLSGYAALDPCIGDGGAFTVIAGNPIAIRYGIELDACRSAWAAVASPQPTSKILCVSAGIRRSRNRVNVSSHQPSREARISSLVRPSKPRRCRVVTPSLSGLTVATAHSPRSPSQSR